MPDNCEWCNLILPDEYYVISLGKRKSGYFCSMKCRSAALNESYLGTLHPKSDFLTPLLGVGWTVFSVVGAFSMAKSSGFFLALFAFFVVWFFGLFCLSILSMVLRR